MVLVLIIILVIILCSGLPIAPWGGWHPYGWYFPSSIVGIMLAVLIIMLLLGYLHR